jgi:hypothetical protein
MKKCRFVGCEKEISDWASFCKRHEKFMKEFKEALDILDVHYHGGNF